MNLRKHLKYTAPVAALLLIVAIFVAGWVAVMGPGHDSADGVTSNQSKALAAATASATPVPNPFSSPKTTPRPIATASSPTSMPTATKDPQNSVDSPEPTRTLSNYPPKPIITEAPPRLVEGDEVVIGGLRITLPRDYDVYDEDGLEAFASGPDIITESNHIYQPTLRMSADGFNDMPEELGELMEGICPSGADLKDYDHKDGEDIMDGDKLVFTRDIYVCPDQSYNYASWQLEDGSGGYRFIADYFYPADRRPSELTEAFVNAKGFGHN